MLRLLIGSALFGKFLENGLAADQFQHWVQANAIGAVIAGVFNAFRSATHTQNVELVGLTDTR